MFPRKPRGASGSVSRPSVWKAWKVEVRLRVVEYGNLRKVKVLEGEGVGHAASGVEGPVRV